MALNSVQKYLRNDIFAFQTSYQKIQLFHVHFTKCSINYACFNCILFLWCPQKLLFFRFFLLLVFLTIFCPLVQIYSWEMNGNFRVFSIFFLLNLLRFILSKNNDDQNKNVRDCGRFLFLWKMIFHSREVKNNCSNLLIWRQAALSQN